MSIRPLVFIGQLGPLAAPAFGRMHLGVWLGLDAPLKAKYCSLDMLAHRIVIFCVVVGV